MENLLTNSGFFENMDAFFSMAEARGVSRVLINCETHEVMVDMAEKVANREEKSETDQRSFYQIFFEKYADEVWVNEEYVQWREFQLVDPSKEEYHLFLGRQLDQLLANGFLIVDGKFPVTVNEKYVEELKNWGLTGRDYEKKYCLLRKMMSLENGRFCLRQEIADRYLKKNKDDIPGMGYKLFFNFVLMCQKVYAEMDRTLGKLSGEPVSEETTADKIAGCFFGVKEEAEAFLEKIKGMKDVDITALVKQLVKDGKISVLSYNKDLCDPLRDAGYYHASNSNWNQQVSMD